MKTAALVILSLMVALATVAVVSSCDNDWKRAETCRNVMRDMGGTAYRLRGDGVCLVEIGGVWRETSTGGNK